MQVNFSFMGVNFSFMEVRPNSIINIHFEAFVIKDFASYAD